ncbi:MAG: PKD domain-containing protein, partial [Bacteroidetes bacterium]
SYYDVKLKVRNADGCTDSLTRSSFIFVTQPLPDFIVSPQINCPGTPSTFVSLASGAGLSYLWDFGDGNTSTLANPTHAYASEGDYTITLTVIDVNGCDSTLVRSNYVKIRELRAQFVADTTYASCPPLSVHFTADTSFIHPEVRWQWDFGNGATSSQPSPTHVYTLPGLYDVTLILSTPTGCSDTLRFEELIEIEGPTAQFGFTPDQGCPGTEVSFTASSEETITYEWVFGDGNTGLGQNTTHTYTTPGLFTPVLVVQDSTGCRVFQVSPDQVRIFEPPTADFSADEPRLCEPGVVSFTDLSQAAPGNQLLHWDWDFGNGLTDTLPSPSAFYGPVGDYSVWLAVTDQRGCSDTLVREGYVRVLLNVTPEPLPLRYVSVRNDTEIEVVFEPFANIRGDFGSYRIYRSESGGPWVLAGEVEDLATNHFTDKNIDTRHHVYCYKAEVVNFCGKKGGIDPVEAHCSINLESQAGLEEVQVNWTPYVGWTDVESYRLYRVQDYSGAGSLIAVVSGTDTTYTDLDMYCYDTYTYRVEAVGRQYLSLSDTSFAAPGKRMPADPSQVVRATVENNEYVLLEWELVPVEDAKDVVIQRDEGFGYQEVMKQAFADPDLKFQDKSTRVDEKSYAYRVFVVDSCGDYSPVGRPGNSIYLQTRRVAGSIYLEWTPYNGWRGGVSSYKIELFNERTGNFEALAVLP